MAGKLNRVRDPFVRNKTMHFQLRCPRYPFGLVSSLAIIALTKSVLHNPPGWKLALPARQHYPCLRSNLLSRARLGKFQRRCRSHSATRSSFISSFTLFSERAFRVPLFVKRTISSLLKFCANRSSM